MRRAGPAGSARSGGSQGHVCCVHDDADDYRRRLVASFAEGLRRGLRVTYAGPDDPEQARADLAGLGDLDQLLGEGAVEIVRAQDVYGTGDVDGERVVGTYAAATERALADGFRGLRVSADASDLVRTPQQRDAWVRYEFRVSRYMSGHPLSALCGFGAELGAETLVDVAALHDAVSDGEPPFRVFGHPDGAVGVAGQFDPDTVAALRRLLTRLHADADGGTLVVDLGGVEYVDHRVLLALSDHARSTRAEVSVRAMPPFATRLLELLPASELRLAEREAGS